MNLKDTILVCLNRVKPYLHKESALLLDVKAENRALNPSRSELRAACDELEQQFRIIALRGEGDEQFKYKLTDQGYARVLEIS
jgi:hypothetical protein